MASGSHNPLQRPDVRRQLLIAGRERPVRLAEGGAEDPQGGTDAGASPAPRTERLLDKFSIFFFAVLANIYSFTSFEAARLCMHGHA